MEKITPFLWYDDKAEEAAAFYVSLFKDSQILHVTRYGEAGKEVHGRPPGSAMTVEFTLAGRHFTALNGGPVFRFTPAVSFYVNCGTAEEVERLAAKLSEGGQALMPVGEYPFSKRYGWIQDRYGLSWQLNATEGKQRIVPALMFVGALSGKAEEAMRFYAGTFEGSSIGMIARYAPGEPDVEGHVKHGKFALAGLDFIAMDSSGPHAFTFSEAASFVVHCASQDDVDRHWDALKDGGDERAQQCGWLKDRYGVSWQVVPDALAEMLADPDPAKSGRVMQAMLKMKKIDVAALRAARDAA